MDELLQDLRDKKSMLGRYLCAESLSGRFQVIQSRCFCFHLRFCHFIVIATYVLTKVDMLWVRSQQYLYMHHISAHTYDLSCTESSFHDHMVVCVVCRFIVVFV